MYSALKINGQKLCDLARQGQTVERKSRPITIERLDVYSTSEPSDYVLDVRCSSGTYIRTLCADIGTALGCGGVMATLCRTVTGSFKIETAHTLSQLEAMSEKERMDCLIPTESLFHSLPALRLPAFFERLCRGGCEIYLKKLGVSFEEGQRIRLLTADGLFSS